MSTKLKKLGALAISCLVAGFLLFMLCRECLHRASSVKHGELGKINLLGGSIVRADISFWGSSTTLVHVSPSIVDSITGLSAYNFGLDGTLFQQYSGFLLSYCQKTDPSYIVIGLNITDFHPRTQIYHPYFYCNAVSDPNVENALSSLDKSLTWKLKTIPLYPLVLFNGEYYINYVLNVNEQITDGSELGYDPQRRFQFTDSEKFPYDSIEIYRPFVENLIAVVKEIKEKGHLPIIFVSPMYYEAYEQIKNMGVFSNVLQELSENDIPVIDLLNSPISKHKDLFYNYLHLNSDGAELFTTELARDIIPHLEKQD